MCGCRGRWRPLVLVALVFVTFAFFAKISFFFFFLFLFFLSTTRLEQEQRTSIAATGPPSPRSRRKRNVQEMDAEEKVDRAANEIVDLVEQAVQHSPSQLTGTRLSSDMHISVHSIATDTTERLAYAGQEEEAIPK